MPRRISPRTHRVEALAHEDGELLLGPDADLLPLGAAGLARLADDVLLGEGAHELEEALVKDVRVEGLPELEEYGNIEVAVGRREEGDERGDDAQYGLCAARERDA